MKPIAIGSASPSKFLMPSLATGSSQGIMKIKLISFFLVPFPLSSSRSRSRMEHQFSTVCTTPLMLKI
jgi:hypothetical protein